MSLKLTWENNNVIPTKTTIYRGSAELNPAALPAPLVTLAAGINEWVDETASFGSTYFYILGSKTENDEVLTPNQKIVVADNRGVGPSELIAGNDNFGYFGQVLSSDFVNSSHFIAAAATTSGLPTAVVTPIWHKFVRKGKILYLPGENFGITNWVSLYRAGFIYGVDGNGEPGANLSGLVLTNQLRTLDFKTNTYKIRCMSGIQEGPLDQTQWITAASDTDLRFANADNEFNDLTYSLQWPVPTYSQKLENVRDELPDIFLGAPYYGNGSVANSSLELARGKIICKERVPNAAVNTADIMTRGQRQSNAGGIVQHTVSSMTTATPIAGNASAIWLPILELVEKPVSVAKE